MSKLVKGIQSGQVSVLAFQRVLEGYIKEKQALNPLDPVNHERLNDLNMSIQFCNKFLLHYGTIRKVA